MFNAIMILHDIFNSVFATLHALLDWVALILIVALLGLLAYHRLQLVFSRRRWSNRFNEILAERVAQIEHGYDAPRDDAHTLKQWQYIIADYAVAGSGAALGFADSSRLCNPRGKTYRRRMIATAALALAAVESYDRRVLRGDANLMHEQFEVDGESLSRASQIANPGKTSFQPQDVSDRWLDQTNGDRSESQSQSKDPQLQSRPVKENPNA